ncbi:MAG: 6-phosphofructokinase 2 [Sediminicola sp.]|jgi:6-phosphofructokinase 2
MNNIITLTVNPVIDKTTTVDGMVPNRKLRCTAPVYFPGGGGINVSRAIQNLGGRSTAIYLAGGASGTHMQELMEARGIAQKVVPQEGGTRENLSVTDTERKLQYRFGVPGAFVKESEWKASLRLIEALLQEGDYLVASGKLPPGVPTTYFAQVAAIVEDKRALLILDTKGDGLKEAIKSPVFLLKPNLSELSALLDKSYIDFSELERLALRFMATHSCDIMVVSMGAKGALLVLKDKCIFIPAPMVLQKNKIGAGDSMVAGMTLGLVEGRSFLEMAQFGVACGTASTMRGDGELCQKPDVDELYTWVKLHTKKVKIISN